jgi:hypothetical protein
MERRRDRRTKKRLACELHLDGRRFLGIVLDVSPQGLFVQTNAKPTPGTEATVDLTLPGTSEMLTMECKVARTKLVPQKLLSIAQGGLGLRLKRPPKAFQEFVRTAGLTGAFDNAESEEPEAPPQPAQAAPVVEEKPEPKPTRFRVRVNGKGDEPQQTFLVDAPNAEKARQRVVARIGDSSRIAAIDPA